MVFCIYMQFVLLQYDIQWSLLSLLLHLANNPTASAHHLQPTHTSVKATEEGKDNFDWASYLREGDEKFVCIYDDSSSVSRNILYLLVYENQ
jgi:hypothetical protein